MRSFQVQHKPCTTPSSHSILPYRAGNLGEHKAVSTFHVQNYKNKYTRQDEYNIHCRLLQFLKYDFHHSTTNPSRFLNYMKFHFYLYPVLFDNFPTARYNLLPRRLWLPERLFRPEFVLCMSLSLDLRTSRILTFSFFFCPSHASLHFLSIFFKS